MRTSKSLVVAGSAFALAAAAAIPATAGTTHHPATGKHGTFHSSLSPTKHIHSGTNLTLKGKGAEKKTNYICILTIVKGKKHGTESLADSKTVKSNKKGKFSCSLTFEPFHATVGGKTRHCPPTKADKKANVKCGFAAADPLNSLTSNTIQYFKPKK